MTLYTVEVRYAPPGVPLEYATAGTLLDVVADDTAGAYLMALVAFHALAERWPSREGYRVANMRITRTWAGRF